MRKPTIWLLTGLFVLGAGALPAGAGTRIFDPPGGDNGLWHVDDNWDPPDAPGDGDTAVIPSGKWCAIEDERSEACDALVVDGRLTVGPDASLRIVPEADEDSTISGTLDTMTGALILIAGDVTIIGNGGDIHVQHHGGVIDHAYEGGTLTIEGSCDPGEEDPSCSLTLHGHGDIAVRLVNNAFVDADTPNNVEDWTLNLKDHAKLGKGVWRATVEGILSVEFEVTGPGTWEIPDGRGNMGEIWIKTACTDLTGDVLLSGGVFKVEENFCTEGDLTWNSGDDGDGFYNTTTIEISTNRSASFAGSCGE